MKSNIIYPDLSYKINGILFKVHNELGKYCNEKQYCDSIEEHLKELKLDYEREKILPISFEGENKGRNKVDFLIENTIILEIKAKRFTSREDYYQARRYLNALNKKMCLLVNFHSEYIKPKRILNSQASE
ncbi:conserved hypothetical protein [Candidatus Roizmanbacteria bacterium]|nr:conserved hypothetical protein [Candidatus Roizmanbacteria bacterium]